MTRGGVDLDEGGNPVNFNSFDQVWDFEFNNSLSVATQDKYRNYTGTAEARLFFAGNPSNSGTRNGDIVNLITSLGGSAVVPVAGFGGGTQSVTMAGGAVTAQTDILFGATITASLVGANGFLVSEISPGSGAGSYLGWGLGNLTNVLTGLDDKLLLSFDASIFSANGQPFTGESIDFLEGAAVPIPASLWLFGSGLLVLLRSFKKRVV